jgi:hypothetical protein
MIRHFLLAATLAVSVTAGAQAPPDYRQVLQTTFTVFDTTYSDITAKTNAGNKLILIAKKYPNEWVPNYYAAYSRVQLSYMEQDEAKREAYIAEANNYLAEAVRLLGKETDETEVLTAMSANAYMAVKPQSRYGTYGKQFNDHLDKAKEMNPNNPRIYLQRGISKYYTPKMFGGGKKAAMPYFEKANELFAKQTDGDMAKPYWGKSALAYFMKMANGDE